MNYLKPVYFESPIQILVNLWIDDLGFELVVGYKVV